MNALRERLLGAVAFPSFVLAAVTFLAATTVSTGFASSANVRILLVTATIVGFAALGQTLVVITGGIDLTIPWLMAIGGLG